MYGIDDPTAVSAMPALLTPGASGFFTGGNPASGLPATVVRADWLNIIQSELLNVLVAGGITPAKGSLNQLTLAIQALCGSGRFLASHIILSSQTFTPLATTRYLRVRMIGGGGAGGGAAGNASGGNGVSCGSAGASGAYAEFRVDLNDVGSRSFLLTVGAKGDGVLGGRGGDGGATSFDGRVICNGGPGGPTSGSIGPGIAISVDQASGYAVALVDNTGIESILSFSGSNGASGFINYGGSGAAGVVQPPVGPSSPLGNGGGNGIGGTPTQAGGLGAGGGASASNTTLTTAGGDGSPGGFLIEEYSA